MELQLEQLPFQHQLELVLEPLVVGEERLLVKHRENQLPLEGVLAQVVAVGQETRVAQHMLEEREVLGASGLWEVVEQPVPGAPLLTQA